MCSRLARHVAIHCAFVFQQPILSIPGRCCTTLHAMHRRALQGWQRASGQEG